jgi:Fe-S cluster biogenesis protein NfuA
MVAADRGEIEWVGMDRGFAEIRLTGACSGCPGQQFTASSVVLPALRSVDPSIKGVRVKPAV